MNVTVPDLGDFSDVEVIDILVAPGDVVAIEDSLITLETEKATMDVPSPAAGTVSEVKVRQGSTVSSGDLIVVLDAGDAGATGDSAGDGDKAESVVTEASPASETDSQSVASETDAPSVESETELQSAEPVMVTVPELGDFRDVDIIEVLVSVGDEVEAEQGLITLETDKATMDVPTPVAGRVVELKVAAGGTINPGEAVAKIEPSAPAAPRQATVPAVPDVLADRSGSRAEDAIPLVPPVAGGDSGPDPFEQTTALPGVGIVDETAFSRAHASPSVRKLARELGVDLGRVKGQGRKGRVTVDDVKSFVKRILKSGESGAGLPKLPVVDFSKFGDVERVKLSRIQKISGPRLHASWVNLPHVTQHDEADITELEEKRQALKGEAAKQDLKLTPLAFIMRAVVLSLEEFPAFRSSLSADGKDLLVKHYYHLGFAADTPNGLVVPVIRDADRMDIFEIAIALGTLSAKARDGKLAADDVSGGVFTVSSLGGIGGSYFTPIINAPEVAILGVSRSAIKPVYDGEHFVPRLMLPLSLSYDHRVIDGAQAARFITYLSKTLGEVDRLLAAIP